MRVDCVGISRRFLRVSFILDVLCGKGICREQLDSKGGTWREGREG